MKSANQTVDIIIEKIKIAKTAFKQKVKVDFSNPDAHLQFPEGFMIVSVKLNKFEREVLNEKLPELKKWVQIEQPKVRCSSLK